MSDPLSVGRRRAKGSWLPRLTGAGLVVVLAAGGVALVYAHSTGASGPPAPRSGPSSARPAQVVSTQTVGLIAFGGYDDKDLYLNDTDDHPLMLKPVGAVVEFVAIPRSQLAAGVPLWTADQMADGSYASANDPRVLVGLGASTAAPTVKVTWPDGHVETFSNIAIDRYTTLAEGSGSK